MYIHIRKLSINVKFVISYMTERLISKCKRKKVDWLWVGCDADGCDYLAHAVCACIKIES